MYDTTIKPRAASQRGGPLLFSGERRLRRSSPYILALFSDKAGFVEVAAGSYRSSPGSGRLAGADDLIPAHSSGQPAPSALLRKKCRLAMRRHRTYYLSQEGENYMLSFLELLLQRFILRCQAFFDTWPFCNAMRPFQEMRVFIQIQKFIGSFIQLS